MMTKAEKYPKDFQEFFAQFKGEDDCWDNIFDMRWPEGFSCPKCDFKQYGKETHDLLPHVHLVDSLVKRWINGVHHGKVSPKHLPHYLDEYAFRFNRRLSTYRGKLFYRLMQQAVDTAPQPFKELIKST